MSVLGGMQKDIQWENAELHQATEHLDFDRSSTLDWMNVDIDSVLELPEMRNEPYPSSNGLTLRQDRARIESPGLTENYQEIVLDLNDFPSPVKDSNLLPRRSTSKEPYPPRRTIVDHKPVDYGSPMDCRDTPVEEHVHRAAYSDVALNNPGLQMDVEFTPSDQGAYSLPYHNYSYGPRISDQHLGTPERMIGDYKRRNLTHEVDSDPDSSNCEKTPVTTHMSLHSKSKHEKGPKPATKSSQPMFKPRQLTKGNPRYHPNEAYKPLRRTPKPWGPFRYTGDGELEPSDLFTAEDITQYLFEHPLHQQSKSKRISKLIVRIHSNPPDSAQRFPTTHGSHRCRFQDCPAQNNTINQGTYAVIFDEISTDHPDHDPFLNAGWVHLYCLERFCNFPKICRCLNVQSEKRTLPLEGSKSKGNNCMRLDKVRGVDELVERFIKVCRQGVLAPMYPRFDVRDNEGQPYEGTLCYRMCLKKQQAQPSAVNRQEAVREQVAGRKGATLKHHLGNLVIEAPIRQTTRGHKNQNQLVANPRQRRFYKHGRVGNESEDDACTYSNHADDGEDGNEKPREHQERYIVPTAKMQPTVPQYQPQDLTEGPENRRNSKKRSWILVDTDDENETISVPKRHRTQAPIEDASGSPAPPW